jgi:antitoxin (DNA-binding transcriptional repressor) of toxin-antitoxin stability system
MQTFSIRDLRERTGDITRAAESGELAVVAKHGEPIFLTVPFDEFLLQHGVKVDVAIKLFATQVLTLAKAARFAGLSQEAFIEILGSIGIPTVTYDPAELDEELKLLQQ